MFNAKITYLHTSTHTHKHIINQNESLTDENTVSGNLIILFVGINHNYYFYLIKMFICFLYYLKADIRTTF